MILDRTQLTIENKQTILDFKREGNEYWPGWYRYITINGEKAYLIGNQCETCHFFFERVERSSNDTSLNLSMLAQEVSSTLSEGLTNLDPNIVNALSMIMPTGKYSVLLTQVTPKLIQPGQPGDYYIEELRALIGDELNIHDPKTAYYRLITKNSINIYQSGSSYDFFEFLIPLWPHAQLNKERIDYYTNMFNEGKTPTAVTLSVMDTHTPEVYDKDELPNHAVLAHYLIDGHHKAYAAALLGKPLTLISFIALEQGLASTIEIDACLRLL